VPFHPFKEAQMQQAQVQPPPAKSAATAATVKVDAAAVTALQSRVAQMTGSAALSSAPYTYHH
jgi:hypothetical protein